MLRAFHLACHLGHLGMLHKNGNTHSTRSQLTARDYHIYCYFSPLNTNLKCAMRCRMLRRCAAVTTHSTLFPPKQSQTVILCKYHPFAHCSAADNARKTTRKCPSSSSSVVWVRCGAPSSFSVHIKLSYEFIRRVHRIYYLLPYTLRLPSIVWPHSNNNNTNFDVKIVRAAHRHAIRDCIGDT